MRKYFQRVFYQFLPGEPLTCNEKGYRVFVQKYEQSEASSDIIGLDNKVGGVSRKICFYGDVWMKKDCINQKTAWLPVFAAV